MKKELFRKVSLDRLSSPEQIDYLLEVTTVRSWVALLALWLVLAAGAAWGFLGTSNTTVAGQGVIVRKGGVNNVVSLAGGRVTDVYVKTGDIIRQDQVIARVAQPALLDKLRSAREELNAARELRNRVLDGRSAGDLARTETLRQQRLAYEQEIASTNNQIRLAKQQIPVDEQLVSKGLITKQAALNNLQNIAALEGNITKLRAQISNIESEGVTMRNQAAQLGLEQATSIEDRVRNLRLIEQELDRSANVTATNSGRVVELKVYPGAIVGAGAPVVSIEPTSETLEVIVYVPAAQAKEIRSGMDAHVSPSGVRREEYGYMLGEVTSVGEFPATSEAIVRTFENEALARSMLQGGPVSELRASLQQNPSTPTGFAWSSPMGPATRITSGSVCAVEVLTRQQPPIVLVIPYLKKQFGLD